MRKSIFIESSVAKKQHGPASYNTQKKLKPKKIMDWSKGNHQRFNSATTLVPGPGQYDAAPSSKKESQPSAAFAY